MKTRFYIYDMQTDEYLGSIIADCIINAELKFSRENDLYSDSIYALSTTQDEPLA